MNNTAALLSKPLKTPRETQNKLHKISLTAEKMSRPIFSLEADFCFVMK
jgi:hypothetical protein